MTISRKEFVRYEKTLNDIKRMVSALHSASFWRGSYKDALKQDIIDECIKLRVALEVRVSKPRPRGQAGAPDTNAKPHDA